MKRNISLDQERAYENQKASDASMRSAQSKYYWATHYETLAHENSIKKISNDKLVLEIGCSVGSWPERNADVFNAYIGIDIADIAIEVAREKNIRNSSFKVCDAHTLPFEDSKFDVIVVNSLLHHLDLMSALPEINRVLAADGVLCLREPLGLNPLFWIYRMLTPSARTIDERPFTCSDLLLLNRYFEPKSVTYFGFLSLSSAFLKFDWLRRSAGSLDYFLARTPLRFLFWQFAGIYRPKRVVGA